MPVLPERPHFHGLDCDRLDDTRPVGIALTESTAASDLTPVSDAKLVKNSPVCSELGATLKNSPICSELGVTRPCRSDGRLVEIKQSSVHVDADRTDSALKARVVSAVQEQLSMERQLFDLVDTSGRVIQSDQELWHASSSSSKSAPVRAVPSEDAIEQLDRYSDELQELRHLFLTEKLSHFERKIDKIASDVTREVGSWEALEEKLMTTIDKKIKASAEKLVSRCMTEALSREAQRITDLEQTIQVRLHELEAHNTMQAVPTACIEDLMARGGQRDESLRRESQRTTDLQNLLVTQSHSLASLSARQSASQSVIDKHGEAIRAQELKTSEFSEKLRLQGERLSESVYTALQRLGDGESTLFAMLVDKLGALAEQFPGALPIQQSTNDFTQVREESPHAVLSKSLLTKSGSLQVSPGTRTTLRNAVSLSSLPHTMPTGRLRDKERMPLSHSPPQQRTVSPHPVSHNQPLTAPRRILSQPSRASLCLSLSPRESLAGNVTPYGTQYGNVPWPTSVSPRLAVSTGTETPAAVRPAREHLLPPDKAEAYSPAHARRARSSSVPGVASPTQVLCRAANQNVNRVTPRQLEVDSGREISPRMFGQASLPKTATLSAVQLSQPQQTERMCRGSSTPAFRGSSAVSLASQISFKPPGFGSASPS